MTEHVLPSKVLGALIRLRRHYDSKGLSDFRDIIDSSRIYITIETDYDNWNGGIWGHDVLLFVPDEIIGLVDLDQQDSIFERFKDDLNKAMRELQNEYVRAAFIKPEDESDPQFQASVPFSIEPRARPEDVGLWKDNFLRLFISHRDTHKATSYELAAALESYGVSSFVAHDAIKPMREWQKEILNGLMTMEVMLVLLTDDFHESEWTNQEVGFALGKGIPIICLKVGNIDPRGFIGARQALKINAKNICGAAPLVHKALIEEIGQEGRLKEILIDAFIHSNSHIDAMEGLDRLTATTDKLTDSEFEKIVKAYAVNSQLYSCTGIHSKSNRFKRYLESATGKQLQFDGRQIKVEKDDFPPF